MIALTLFWISAAVIVYAVLLFPLLLWLRAQLWRQRIAVGEYHPRLSVLIAAYNEERNIAARLDNLLSADYPQDRLEIIVASDGSEDRTHEIVRAYPTTQVRLLELPRRGKGDALNDAAEQATGEVLVFTDANTEFTESSLKALVQPFADPSIGGVAGHQVYLRDKTASLTADGECLYWSFDSWLKQLQSRAGSVTSATGAIYGIRRGLYEAVPDDAMDDFFISTGVIARGYRLVFCPQALALEPVATAGTVEISRKRRIVAQGLRSVVHRRKLLNPLVYGFYSIQLFSHKVLRRLLALPAIVMGLASVALWSHGWFYPLFTVAMISFVALAIIGWLGRGMRWGRFRVLTVPFFICAISVTALSSAILVLRGGRITRWEPERHTG